MKTPNKINIKKDVYFASYNDFNGISKSLTLDLYIPNTSNQKLPLIIFSHSGFFLFGDKSEFSEICIALAEAGFITSSINYRLWDNLKPPTPKEYILTAINAVADLKAAVRYFHKSCDTYNEYNIDSSNVFIAGYSAGAIISLLAGYLTEENLNISTLQEAISFPNYILNNSSNLGYRSDVTGVISISGALPSKNIIGPKTLNPCLLCIHPLEDDIVPFSSGQLKGLDNQSLFEVDGSECLIERAKIFNIYSHLVTIPNVNHDFLSKNTDYKNLIVTSISQFINNYNTNLSEIDTLYI